MPIIENIKITSEIKSERELKEYDEAIHRLLSDFNSLLIAFDNLISFLNTSIPPYDPVTGVYRGPFPRGNFPYPNYYLPVDCFEKSKITEYVILNITTSEFIKTKDGIKRFSSFNEAKNFISILNKELNFSESTYSIHGII